jgi:hypothetical protein
MSWFDTDGDGKIDQEELNNCRLFHRAPHLTQEYLRREENLCVLHSLTKTDFTSLLKMAVDEQLRLMVKLKSRLCPKKNRPKKNKSKASRKKTATTSKQSLTEKNNSSTSSGNNKTNKTNKTNNNNKKSRKKPIDLAPTDARQTARKSLFLGTGTKQTNNKRNEQYEGDEDEDEDWNEFQRLEPHDHLNCAVPPSMRSHLSRSGVSLSDQTDEDHMYYKLSTTKTVYNKIWEKASSRKDTGSFHDLTLPGSDRAMRLSRLKKKQTGWM